MPPWMPLPILALAPGQIFALIVFTISIISWIVNIVNGIKGNVEARPKNRPRDQVQSELEKFLQEVVGGKKQANQERPQQKQKKGGKQKSQQQRSAKALAGSSSRPGELVAQSHLPTTTMDGGVRSHHLQTSVDVGRIGAAVQLDIDGAVLKDLGADRSAETGERANTPHPILVALRNREGVRQAILFNEVLGKPKALR
jgi:hypothetical protein